MRTHFKALGLIAGLCIGCVVWFGLGPAKRAQGQPQRPLLSQIPRIKSCVEHVKLVKAELVNQGDSQVIALELENQAYVDVIAISVENIYKGTKDSLTLSAFTPDKDPLIEIPVGGRKTITVGNLNPETLIRIGGVTFSDGSEEGCDSSLKTIRKIKDRDTKKAGTSK
jgi:hypothetical protein